MARPTKLTDSVQHTITELLRNGNTHEGACAAAGVHPATFYRWMETGEADDEHDRDTNYREFRDEVIRAIGESEACLVEYARCAASKDGRVALEMLARRFPERWASKAEIRGRVHHTSERQDGLVVPDDEKRMTEVAVVLHEIGLFGGNGANGDSE